MADVKWIKIVTDVFDDEKIKLIDALPECDSIIVIWFKTLCLAGKQNNGGVLMLNDKIAYTDEMLSTIFRRPINTVRLALKTFEEFGMIEIVNNTITIPNWDKHQSLDKLEQAKEKTRKRVAKHREKQKLLAENKGRNVTETLQVTQGNTTEEEKEKEIEKDIELEVEVVKGADAPDNDPDRFLKNDVFEELGTTEEDEEENNKLQIFRGRVMFTENQLEDLLNKLDLEAFEEYVDRLNNFIIEKNATIKSHYATILKWYNEDRAVAM